MDTVIDELNSAVFPYILLVLILEPINVEKYKLFALIFCDSIEFTILEDPNMVENIMEDVIIEEPISDDTFKFTVSIVDPINVEKNPLPIVMDEPKSVESMICRD